jgi:hypothetical protein
MRNIIPKKAPTIDGVFLHYQIKQWAYTKQTKTNQSYVGLEGTDKESLVLKSLKDSNSSFFFFFLFRVERSYLFLGYVALFIKAPGGP